MKQAYRDSTVLLYLPVPRRQSHWRSLGNKILFRSRATEGLQIFGRRLKQSNMDETQSMGEFQEAGTPPQRLFPPSDIAHCPRGGTGMFPAAAYSAASVLRTTANTEVAGDPSDGGDGVEPSSPNGSGISFRNNCAPRGAELRLGTVTAKGTPIGARWWAFDAGA